MLYEKGENMSDINKDQITLNKNKRWWSKFGKWIITAICVAGGIVAIVLAVVFGGGGSGAPAKTDKEETTETAETTTAAPSKLEGQIFKLSGTVAAEDFVNQGVFQDSAFIGDDLFDYLAGYSLIDQSRVFAKEGAKTEDGLASVDKVKALNPKKVFINYGRNDLNFGNGRNAETTSDAVTELVTKLKEALPDATIYVVSMMPITQDLEISNGTYHTEKDVDALNTALSTKTTAAGPNYIDITAPFKKNNGYLNDDYTADGYTIRKAYFPFLLNGIAKTINNGQ